MGKVAADDRRRALEVARADLDGLDSEEERLQHALDEVSAKRNTLAAFIAMQEAALDKTESKTDNVLEALREASRAKKLSIREAVVFLAERLPDRTITNQYAKEIIVDELELGTTGAVNTFLSRSKVLFAKVDRGTYRLLDNREQGIENGATQQPPLITVSP